GSSAQFRWFERLLLRLLEADPATLALLSRDPFHGEAPRWIRARLFDYRYTTPRELRERREWWHREEAATLIGPVRRCACSEFRGGRGAGDPRGGIHLCFVERFVFEQLRGDRLEPVPVLLKEALRVRVRLVDEPAHLGVDGAEEPFGDPRHPRVTLLGQHGD